MTNLDSIFKSRDISLPTKFCLVKAMVFPVVMYGYATGDQWINNSRKNEGMEPKQKQYPAVDVTNLDSILKSRDIPLPTKVRLVKAMVFPVVRYGCESWIVKKAECRRIDAFEL